MNKTNFEKVQQFHKAFKIETPEKFTILDDDQLKLRWRLIDEEIEELYDAIDSGNKYEIAKEMADVLYVVYGMADFYGIDIDEVFAEVHRSNMSKLDSDGNPIYREDGKVLKSENFFKADLTDKVK